MNYKKVVIILVLCLLFLFSLRYAGYVINVPSRVTVDTGITVKAETFNGDTTNFVQFNDSQLQDIINVILERTVYGKILFNESVNLTKDAVDNVVDIDSNVNISYNFISINTDSLTSLNNRAIFTLYDLNFTNPRILKDGALCSDCIIIGYNSGNLGFSASGNGEYSAEETPVNITSPTPGRGGGGGGGGSVSVSNFSLNTDVVRVSLSQGDNSSERFLLKNTGNTDLNFNLSTTLSGVLVRESAFSLKPGESKEVFVDFLVEKEKGVYFGKISVSAAGITREVSVIIEIKEKNPLLDVNLGIVNRTVETGKEVKVNISLINNNLGNISVLLYYSIEDLNRNVIEFRQERLDLDRALNLVRSFEVRDRKGTYLFYVNASYGNLSVESTDFFRVSETESPLARNSQFFLALTLGFIVIVIGLIVIVIVRRMYSLKNNLET